MHILTARAPASEDLAPGLFDRRDKPKWADIDRKPFEFRHGLAGHPLFERARLAKLAQQMLDRGEAFRCFASNMQCDASQLRRRLAEAILDMEQANSWIKLSHANQVAPDFDDLFQSLLAELECMLDMPLREQATWSGMTVFMNPPDYVVPYHFDHESNLLLQIVGEKEVRLYPPDERVLTDSEIEGFYHGNVLAGRYRDDVEPLASRHVITPGTGVHHPPLAPHSVRNDKQTSISLSLYYSLPAHDAKARVRQFNWYLRRMGIDPSPAGHSALSDKAKCALIEALQKPHPDTWDEYMYSGVQRINRPFRVAKRIGQKVASLAHGPGLLH